MRKVLWFVGVVIIIITVVVVVWYQRLSENKNISSFDECVAAGNIVLDSYPAQCRTKDGQSFTQEIGNELEFSDEIIVSNPRPNQTVKNPLQLAGQARGSWYFEATAPVRVTDTNGVDLGQGYITASGEWMTMDFVPFIGTINLTQEYEGQGWIIFTNSNPSGLPENDKQVRMPVIFSSN